MSRAAGRTSRAPNPGHRGHFALGDDAFFGMAQREALGWSCTGLGVTVAGRSAPVLRRARETGSQAYFVLDVLVVSVFGGGGGRGGQGRCGHVQWTSSCDHAATSSAVLCRISYDVGVVPQRQFIDRVDSVRDGVLLVLPSVVHRDRYPQCFPLSRVRGVAVH